MNTLQTAVQAVIAEWEEHGFATDGQMEYLSKALADEQAQPANSRISSLYEELRKATDCGSESMTHDDALKQIAYWQHKEQSHDYT